MIQTLILTFMGNQIHIENKTRSTLDVSYKSIYEEESIVTLSDIGPGEYYYFESTTFKLEGFCFEFKEDTQ
jgi:hypothetical protein